LIIKGKQPATLSLSLAHYSRTNAAEIVNANNQQLKLI